MAHSVRPLSLSKHTSMMHECQRLLEHREPGIMEAAQVAVHHVDVAKGQLVVQGGKERERVMLWI